MTPTVAPRPTASTPRRREVAAVLAAVTRGYASQPATVTFTVKALAPLPMRLATGTSQVPVGQPPTLTLTVPNDATGSVGFYDKEIPGTDKGIGTATIVDGVTTLTTPTRPLPPGVNHFHAAYDGGNRYAANTSNVVSVTVGGS